MFKVVLVTALMGALAQECIQDRRLQALTADDFQQRQSIQAFSKNGMWKMPKLAQHASEEELEDCASCTDAEVQVELMKAQLGETQFLNEIDGVFYPVQNQYAPNGFKLSYKDIPHEVPEKVMKLLDHRLETKDIQILPYRQYDTEDAARVLVSHDHEELNHIAPAGLSPLFQEGKPPAEPKEPKPSKHNLKAKNHTKPKAPKPSPNLKVAQKGFAEYASQVRLLRDLEKTTTKGSGMYLVLKEGFILSTSFKSAFKKVLQTAPKDWDVLLLHAGASKDYHVRCQDKIDSESGIKMYETRRPITLPEGQGQFYEGLDGYVIRRQSIPRVLSLLHSSKAAPLTELLMSVHSEEKERNSDGKTNYKVDGIYSYTVAEKLLEKIEVPKPPMPKPIAPAPQADKTAPVAKLANKTVAKPILAKAAGAKPGVAAPVAKPAGVKPAVVRSKAFLETPKDAEEDDETGSMFVVDA